MVCLLHSVYDGCLLSLRDRELDGGREAAVLVLRTWLVKDVVWFGVVWCDVR